jgi:hypothetical protein
MTLAISAISICNSGLIKLGQEPISSLAQDTKTARLCNAIFEVCRNEVLEAHPWCFATKTQELASVVAEDTLEIWQYLYQLPADFLKPVLVDDEKQEYEIRDGYLMADNEPVVLKYIYENTNTGTWSYSFAQCLSWRIAAEIAYALTNSTTIAEAMFKGYDMSLRAARYNDSLKKAPHKVILDSFIDVRN